MTDFRRVQDLRAYSGGTVPVSDRISYSLRDRKPAAEHLNEFTFAL